MSAYPDKPGLVVADVDGDVDDVRFGGNVRKSGAEQFELLRAADRWSDENHTGMDRQSRIAALELDRVVGDEHPIAIANDGQEVPVAFRGEAEMDDMHGLETGGVRGLRQRHRQVFVDEEARLQSGVGAGDDALPERGAASPGRGARAPAARARRGEQMAGCQHPAREPRVVLPQLLVGSALGN